LTGICGVRIKVVHKCMGDYTTIASLPHVLLIPLEQPTTLGAEQA
jgi:hypothetical protein